MGMDVAPMRPMAEPTSKQAVRLAAVGDLHVKKTSQGQLAPLLAPVNERADVLLLCGDLTDYGLPEETQILVKELTPGRAHPDRRGAGQSRLRVGPAADVCKLLTEAGVTVLDGEAAEIAGVGFAGVKGFPGGFGRGTLGAWGEPGVKAFVKEAIDEAMKLESALARLRTPQRVAVLHYSPIRETVEGEPPEIFPISARAGSKARSTATRSTSCSTAMPITVRSKAARRWAFPVFNVAMPLLMRAFPDKPPFRVFELPLAGIPATEIAPRVPEPARVLENS